MDKHKNAINYVTTLIKSLDSTAVVEVNQSSPIQYSFHVDMKGQQLKFIFSRSTMDDFENGITNNKGADWYYASEGLIKFQIYIGLGQAGVISDFDVSREILDEKRDWLKNYSIKIERPDWLYKIFYQGLKVLLTFLDDLVEKHKLLSKDIEEEQVDIKWLIDFYEKNHSFEEGRVSTKSLGYFKAAAVCVILQKEKEKKSISIPRVLQAKDKEIYSIVAELREGPFPQIKMPDCIYDYAVHINTKEGKIESAKSSTNNLVFIACGQLTDEEKSLGKKVQELLKEHGIVSFLAENVNDLESLNSHIFKNLTECTGFIGILHNRDSGKYDTSVWINQEVAIAAYLRSTGKTIPSLVLYEEGATIEGLIKYTIANPQTFKSEAETLSKIKEWITRQSFAYEEKLPEFDIILNEERKHFGSSAGGGRIGYHDIGYHLSFIVRNKSSVNICLEDVYVENELLGKGQLDKSNARLSKLPFNIGPRMTEEVNVGVKFPNSLDENMKGKDINLNAIFKFADRVITKQLVGYIS